MANSDVNINKIRANTIASLDGLGLNKNAIEQQIADAIEQSRMQAQSNKNMASAVAVSESEAVNYKSIEKEVKKYLQEYELEKIRTNGDGNCFFYAVQGYGDIKGIPELSVSVLEMRETVAQTIETKKGIYLPSFRSNAELEAHVAEIRMCEERNQTERNPYADEVDVAAFSDHFNVCIVIHDWRKTNYTPYHIRKISYPGECDVGGHTNPNRIHILRTNENHYSLLMPVADPEYNALKNLVVSVYLPLKPSVAGSHLEQLAEMAKHTALNLSRVQLNQSAAAASSSPRPLSGNARNAGIHLNLFDLNSAPAAASRSALNHAQPYNLSLTPERVAEQLAIKANLNQRATRAASSSSSAANRPLELGDSKAYPIVFNGPNLLAQAAASSSSAANRPLGLGKSATSAIPLNGLNMPAQAAASSSSALAQNANNATKALSSVNLTKSKVSKVEKIKGQFNNEFDQ
jgi:hypothetical protein